MHRSLLYAGTAGADSPGDGVCRAPDADLQPLDGGQALAEIGGQPLEFNEKLQLLRKQLEMTQEQLAEKLFVSRTAVSKWESGKGYPNIDSLRNLAEFFSVSIDELLSGSDIHVRRYIRQQPALRDDSHQPDDLCHHHRLSVQPGIR